METGIPEPLFAVPRVTAATDHAATADHAAAGARDGDGPA